MSTEPRRTRGGLGTGQVLALVLLGVLGIAAWDATRPVETWREPAGVQVLGVEEKLHVFLELRRRFQGTGLVFTRGELEPLYFQKALVVERFGLGKIGESFLTASPRLAPDLARVYLDGGRPHLYLGPEDGRQEAIFVYREPRWKRLKSRASAEQVASLGVGGKSASEAVPALEARTRENQGAPTVVIPDLAGSGRASFELDGVGLTIAWETSGDTGRVVLREERAGGREVELHKVDLEVSRIERHVLDEQRAKQGPLLGFQR